MLPWGALPLELAGREIVDIMSKMLALGVRIPCAVRLPLAWRREFNCFPVPRPLDDSAGPAKGRSDCELCQAFREFIRRNSFRIVFIVRAVPHKSEYYWMWYKKPAVIYRNKET